MDMKKYASDHFIKVDDVRDGPIEGDIVAVKDGQFDKPNVTLETGDTLSVNATNFRILSRAYGLESDVWVGKTIRLFLGSIKYQGKDNEAVIVEPISPPIKKKTKEVDGESAPKKPDMDDEIPF
jgi:hypothetical protein